MRIWTDHLRGELYFSLTSEELSDPVERWRDLVAKLKKEIPRERRSFNFADRIWTILFDNWPTFYFVYDNWRSGYEMDRAVEKAIVLDPPEMDDYRAVDQIYREEQS